MFFYNPLHKLKPGCRLCGCNLDIFPLFLWCIQEKKEKKRKWKTLLYIFSCETSYKVDKLKAFSTPNKPTFALPTENTKHQNQTPLG